MKIESSGTEIPFLIIRDLYDEDELRMIKKEIDFIHAAGCFTENTGSAQDTDGNKAKRGKGIWLDGVYRDRNTSMILRLNRKPICDAKIQQAFMNLSPYHDAYRLINKDTTLLHYYENGDAYKSHRDATVFSCITWFFNSPKKFKGGNLTFTELNVSIEIEDNMCVIFPGVLWHEVEEIKMQKDNGDEKNGRYSLAQFMMIDAVSR
jgi:hypothetical protein